MPYKYPPFARVTEVVQDTGRRYRLEVEMDTPGDTSWIVIQKNPSRADPRVSDHTVNRVLHYLWRNREKYPCLSGIGRVVFLNLIPWQETYSHRLAKKWKGLPDPRNLQTIAACLGTGSPCLVAWGNPPAGLGKPYAALSEKVLELLSACGTPTYRVGPLTRLGYPRHGQIWGYKDPLQEL